MEITKPELSINQNSPFARWLRHCWAYYSETENLRYVEDLTKQVQVISQPSRIMIKKEIRSYLVLEEIGGGIQDYRSRPWQVWKLVRSHGMSMEAATHLLFEGELLHNHLDETHEHIHRVGEFTAEHLYKYLILILGPGYGLPSRKSARKKSPESHS